MTKAAFALTFALLCTAAWSQAENPDLRSIGAAKKLLEGFKETLSDPDSVKFRNLQLYYSSVHPLPGFKGSYTSICGEVNAKNRYGGYVGFTPFYAVETSGKMFFKTEPSSDDCSIPLKKGKAVNIADLK